MGAKSFLIEYNSANFNFNFYLINEPDKNLHVCSISGYASKR